MAITQLSSAKHRDLRVATSQDVTFLEKLPYLPVLVTEFTHVGIDCPIVFLKHSETGKLQPVAMLSLEKESNVFVRDGRWLAQYLPSAARQAPFKLIASEQNPNDLFIGIDTDDESVGETEGERLFDEDGKETAYLEQRKASLAEFAQGSELTEAFVNLMLEHDMLKEKSITFEAGSEKGEITGLYMVDEDRLKALADDTFLEMRRKGFLAVVYAHLLSLNQIRRLTPGAARNAAG